MESTAMATIKKRTAKIMLNTTAVTPRSSWA
jgi:hypothetical protein